MSESKTTKRIPFIAPRCLMLMLLTGGLCPLASVGSISPLSALRDNPVHGHVFPGLGSRMNSGLMLFSSAACTGATVQNLLESIFMNRL
jgi:hypothetical protein